MKNIADYWSTSTRETSRKRFLASGPRKDVLCPPGLVTVADHNILLYALVVKQYNVCSSSTDVAS